MNRLLIQVATAQRGVFTRSQALASGASPKEIRRLVSSGAWVALRRGAYVSRESWSGADPQVRAVQHAIALGLTSPSAVVSHRSAAALWELPLLRPAAPPEVTVAGNGNRSTRQVRHAGELPTADVTALAGVRITAVARTVADVARTGELIESVMVADRALALGLIDQQALQQQATAMRTSAGVPGLHRVIRLARAGSESAGESLARVVLIGEGIPEPELQIQIGAYRVDMLWRRQRTIGEFDGRIKYGSDAAGDPGSVLWREKQREDWLREQGFEVVRFTWAQLTESPATTADRVRAAFARAQRRSASGSPHAVA